MSITTINSTTGILTIGPNANDNVIVTYSVQPVSVSNKTISITVSITNCTPMTRHLHNLL